MRHPLISLCSVFTLCIVSLTAFAQSHVVQIMDPDSNVLWGVNDEGDRSSITLPGAPMAPVVTSNKLYVVDGNLHYNGQVLFSQGNFVLDSALVMDGNQMVHELMTVKNSDSTGTGIASTNSFNGIEARENDNHGFHASSNGWGYYALNNTWGFHAEYTGFSGFRANNNGQHGFISHENEEDGYQAYWNGFSGFRSFDNNDYGFFASSNGEDGIYSLGNSGDEGYFDGTVTVTGNLSKGGGSFKIDHPLDPENKFLYHSFVESPDMMNVYNGNVVLDANGEAVVKMETWFEPLNRDFRYQLTAIGAPGPNLYIAQEMQNNAFKIAGGSPGMKVSWQVTGIRQDPYANAHRIPVEEEKPTMFKGFYLHPEVYGHSFKEGLSYVKLGGKTLEDLRAEFATEKSEDKSETLPARTKD